MAAARTAVLVKELPKGVKPLLSNNSDESRRRIISLYRSWMRCSEYLTKTQDLSISERMMKEKVRDDFERFKTVSDLRVLDSMIAKSTLELEEAYKGWQQTTHILRRFKQTVEPRKTDFMSKFYHKNRS